jgi:hypothetical protein
MKFIECKIVAAVLQPVYQTSNLLEVHDFSMTPVIAWKIDQDVVTPVTCMGVVDGPYMVKHENKASDIFYIPRLNEEFGAEGSFDSSGKKIPGILSWREQIVKKFQAMHEARS